MMVITNKAAVQRVAQVYQEQRQANRVRKQAGNPSYNDEVTLSAEGKEMQAMLQKLQNVPDIRPRAEDIKVALQDGTYQVSARQVAQGIIDAQSRG
ncbi:MAG TPA: flagellar biosynthesis anti-sigma factor FlgM [Limnochordia bacterium]|nr:flagellar biosynthesis anti-sigma factor FlgM [Limnochordia bacterium]